MNAVIGTAGHVDHGKSSLINALTGIHWIGYTKSYNFFKG